MTPPPELKFENGKLLNWEELRGWMMRNDPLTYNIIAYCDKLGGSEEDAIRIISFQSAVQRTHMFVPLHEPRIVAAIQEIEKTFGGLGWNNTTKQMLAEILRRHLS